MQINKLTPEIHVYEDYPRSVTILADWFETYLQPEIKKE